MHAVKPLPFAASKLGGLSGEQIVSHYEDNYGGAVKNQWDEVNRRLESAQRRST